MEIPGLSTLLSDNNSPTLLSVVQVYANELVQQLLVFFLFVLAASTNAAVQLQRDRRQGGISVCVQQLEMKPLPASE